jgi:hypothetical protein
MTYVHIFVQKNHISLEPRSVIKLIFSGTFDREEGEAWNLDVETTEGV